VSIGFSSVVRSPDYLRFFTAVNSRHRPRCTMICITKSSAEKALTPMIDGWFSVLVITFISSVGGLGWLLIESYRDELLQQRSEPQVAPPSAIDETLPGRTGPQLNGPQQNTIPAHRHRDPVPRIASLPSRGR
jgi:hypothetical protein